MKHRIYYAPTTIDGSVTCCAQLENNKQTYQLYRIEVYNQELDPHNPFEDTDPVYLLMTTNKEYQAAVSNAAYDAIVTHHATPQFWYSIQNSSELNIEFFKGERQNESYVIIEASPLNLDGSMLDTKAYILISQEIEYPAAISRETAQAIKENPEAGYSFINGIWRLRYRHY